MVDLLNTLAKHNVPVDLSLMVLGNAATNIINGQLPPEKRRGVAEGFAKALVSSVSDDQAH